VKSVKIGKAYTLSTRTTRAHTAHAYGNDGVFLVGTPALIGFLETASNECIKEVYEENEGSVGTAVSVRHVAAAPEGAVIDASASVQSVEGRQVTFTVSARWNGKLLMEGTHARAVVDLPRLLRKLAST
jgi:predicted thioesterase